MLQQRTRFHGMTTLHYSIAPLVRPFGNLPQKRNEHRLARVTVIVPEGLLVQIRLPILRRH